MVIATALAIVIATAPDQKIMGSVPTKIYGCRGLCISMILFVT
jgi:hypothetical protein